MRKKLFILFLIGVIITSVCAQEKVFFFNSEPVADGKIDEFLSPGLLQPFHDVYKSNDDLTGPDVLYLLGYTRNYFYIYIEVAADSIITRDRAYQNGDGFHFTIGLAKDDGSETDEFYVFGFSPSNDWTRKIEWYRNIDLSMKRLGKNVIFETFSGKNKIGFELLIPWYNMSPFHPWFQNNLGFNLCFVKAINEKDKIYHFLKVDERMQSEQSKRKYENLIFEKPLKYSGYFALPARNNYTTGDTLELEISGYAGEYENKSFHVKMISNENVNYSEEIEINFSRGFNNFRKKLKHPLPAAGSYTMLVFDEAEIIGTCEISIFKKINLGEVRNILFSYNHKIASGTYNTLLFQLNELELELKQLKHYEASASVALKISELNRDIAQLCQNCDPYSSRRGMFRRAFLSDFDQTLQPYSIYVPEDYDPGKSYPLLVYLHGSGQDDRALFAASFIKQGFIVMAPNGRGTSNCFASAESLTDVREAIADVRRNYQVDNSKLILSGFSMGGYGVYRLFHEYPDMFSALAILSGHPDLARKWGIPNPVGFLNEEIISEFAGIPVFIYHGKKDLNCPYAITLDFANRLTKYSQNVVFYTDENAGHSAMSEEIRNEYYKWLIAQVAD